MQFAKQFCVTFVAALLLTACTNSYTRVETGGTERTSLRIDDSAAILITTPKDGGYGTKIFNGSGAVVARTIDASFSRYARLVDVYPSEYRSLNDLYGTIAQNGYNYIVVPTIPVWGSKDSEWSRIPNQVGVKIAIIDAATGKDVSSNFLQGKNKPSVVVETLFDSEAEKPDELLADLSDDYVDDLYGVIISLPSR